MHCSYFCGPILAIESSCDETSVAIVDKHAQLLAHLVASQSKLHAGFGGVVPELASRHHLSTIDPLFHAALQKAQLQASDLRAVAATAGPGLAPALLVGASYAKGIALGLGIPYLAMNHLEGHLLSPFFGQKKIPAHLSLLVSGGHTQLTKVISVGSYQLLGRTHDDAAGEAFDKVGKLLGLSYPAGVQIDVLARQGNARKYAFPRALLEKGNLDFSFSGLKTAVRYFLEKQSSLLSSSDLADLCASFQEAIVEVLVEKTRRAAKKEGLCSLGVSGGVAANSRLQCALQVLCEENDWEFHLPAPSLIGDNAAMIAFAAWHHLIAGERTPISEEIISNWEL